MTSETVNLPISTKQQSEELCTTLQETLVRLIDLLQTEISLIKNKQTKDITSLADEKNSLTNAFLKLFSTLRANAVIIGRHSPKQVAHLRRMIDQFQTVMQSNLLALRAAKSVNETLIGTIVDLSAKKNKGPTAYGKNGSLKQAETTRATPIAINKVL